MLLFERKDEPLAANPVFLKRLAASLLIAGIMVGALVALGAWGFVAFENQSALDAIHNSVRIVCGLEPARPAVAAAGKWFEIVFHLVASLVVVVATTVFLMPILHRVLHHFHIDDGE